MTVITPLVTLHLITSNISRVCDIHNQSQDKL